MTIKRIRIALFICYIIFILWITIFSRHSNGEHKAELRLMWSCREMFAGNPYWKQYVWQNIKNVLFFIPFGILFPVAKWHIVLVAGLILSVMVESVQYFACLGLCELDDVLCNGFGSLVGCFLVVFIQKLITKTTAKD